MDLHVYQSSLNIMQGYGLQRVRT